MLVDKSEIIVRDGHCSAGCVLFCFLLAMLAKLCLSFTTTYAYDPLTVQNNIYGIGIINHSDLEDVSNLVNSNNGDWGYVTIVITESNRNHEIWQKFMDDCRRLHLIPIVRVASKFTSNNWETPRPEEIDNWVNFFNSLNWVVENRYVVIANEPNHAKEWGGKISPSEYAIYLKTFAERLHNASNDYFVLNAGFDQDAPNSEGTLRDKATMDEKKYIDEMIKTVPDVFNFIDGWSSHSYPNPAFSGSKMATGRRSIKGYEWELNLIKKQNLPVFITETGWALSKINDQKLMADNMKYAFQEVWDKDKRIIAVTPFILNYTEEPFLNFSWKKSDGSYFPIYSEIQNLQKIRGLPKQKISGEIIFNFLNPLMIRNSEQKGFTVVKNTGQAIWTQSESNVINEQASLINEQASLINEKALLINDSENEITVSNTKFNQIEPFANGLVTYTLKSSKNSSIQDVKLGFYVRGEKIGSIYNGKIISF